MQNVEASIDRRVMDTLLENLDGDVATLSELTTTFLEDTPQRVAELELALSRRDVSLLGKAAHTFKGTSMAFGATALSTVCTELQQKAAAGTFDGVAEQIRFIEEEFARVQTFLAKYLKSLQSSKPED